MYKMFQIEVNPIKNMEENIMNIYN